MAQLYRPAIGDIYVVRRARITLEHVAAHKRIDVRGYLTVEAEGEAPATGDVQCGIPGFDHPGAELMGNETAGQPPRLAEPIWEVPIQYDLVSLAQGRRGCGR